MPTMDFHARNPNTWARYRDPGHVDFTDAEIQQRRMQNRPLTVHHVAPALPVPALRQPAQHWNMHVPVPDADAIAFMAEEKLYLPPNHTSWQATKFLGSGGYGMVALWEYKPQPGDPAVRLDKIVIKEALVVDNRISDLEPEIEMMEYLSYAPHEHIVQMIGDRQVLGDDDPSVAMRTRTEHGYTPDRVGRMFLQYMPLGDLFELLEYREKRLLYFDETTLWSILGCLVDAALLLQTGEAELGLDNDGGKVLRERILVDDSATNTYRKWKPIIHFDLKPENIFLNERNTRHAHTPVCVVGDFGLAAHQPADRAIREDIETLRGHGTPGHYTPEQFTEAWDFDDWETSHAGDYSSHTNLWQMAGIMYQLVTLQRQDTVDHTKPFFPHVLISGAPAKGMTFAWDLSRSINPVGRYSEMLIHTLWEMLYEKPRDRPGLVELKERVEDGLVAAQNAAVASGYRLFEPWDDFIPAPPPPPAPAQLQNQDDDDDDNNDDDQPGPEKRRRKAAPPKKRKKKKLPMSQRGYRPGRRIV